MQVLTWGACGTRPAQSGIERQGTTAFMEWIVPRITLLHRHDYLPRS
jgi:hypothetical protein